MSLFLYAAAYSYENDVASESVNIGSVRPLRVLPGVLPGTGNVASSDAALLVRPAGTQSDQSDDTIGRSINSTTPAGSGMSPQIQAGVMVVKPRLLGPAESDSVHLPRVVTEERGDLLVPRNKEIVPMESKLPITRVFSYLESDPGRVWEVEERVRQELGQALSRASPQWQKAFKEEQEKKEEDRRQVERLGLLSSRLLGDGCDSNVAVVQVVVPTCGFEVDVVWVAGAGDLGRAVRTGGRGIGGAREGDTSGWSDFGSLESVSQRVCLAEERLLEAGGRRLAEKLEGGDKGGQKEGQGEGGGRRGRRARARGGGSAVHPAPRTAEDLIRQTGEWSSEELAQAAGSEGTSGSQAGQALEELAVTMDRAATAITRGASGVLAVPGPAGEAEGERGPDGFDRAAALRRLSARRQIRAALGLSKEKAGESMGVCEGSAGGRDERSLEAAVSMSESAVSNLLGSVTEFTGRQVIEKRTADMALVPGQLAPRSYGERGSDSFETEVQTLYTGCPSRAVFPRGFLWDEGFHAAVAAAVDPAVSADVFRAWMSTMNGKGWIPREQILGAEARGAVPPAFRVQRRLVANPPAMLLGVSDTVKALSSHGLREQVEAGWRRGALLSAAWKLGPGSSRQGEQAEVDAAGALAGVGASSGGAASCVHAALEGWDGSEEGAWAVLDTLMNECDGEGLGTGASHGGAIAPLPAPEARWPSADELKAFALRKMLRHYRWLVRTQAGATVGGTQVAKVAVDPARYGVLKAEVKPGAPTAAERAKEAADRWHSSHWTFRWRGDEWFRGNHTFPSGLDDWPRGVVHTTEDAHADLGAWLAWTAGVLAGWAQDLGHEAMARALREDRARIMEGLELLWDETTGLYCDWGLQEADDPTAHAAGQRLHNQPVQSAPLLGDALGRRLGAGTGVEAGCSAAGGGRAAELEPFYSRYMRRGKGVRGPAARFGCVCHEGYASLLPAVLGLLEDDGGRDSDRLRRQLQILSSTEGMMSSCGLRSLSKGRGMGGYADAEDERRVKGMYRDAEDYWRGKVWMNLNFLALRSARRYAAGGGPNAELARGLGEMLRCRMAGCVTASWQSQGEMHENFDGDVTSAAGGDAGAGGASWVGGMLASVIGGGDGGDVASEVWTPREAGTGAHPFTGWSALAARVVAGRIGEEEDWQ